MTAIPFPDKKHNIIYADPPWSYKNGNGHPRWAGDSDPHYETQAVNWIENLPIQDIAEKNCMLFLWATFPCLQEALDVCKSWGFTYKTLGFSWIKTNKDNGQPFFGIGYYTKSNCEVCLIGVKGKPIKISNNVSSVIQSPIERHSKKPDCTRDLIVELCGDIPRIELFGRRAADGWDTWGNEVEESYQLDIFKQKGNI